MDGYIKNGDVSGGHGSMKSHSIYQHNDLKPLINLNNRDDIDMSSVLKNGYVSSGIGLINRHALYQFNKSSYFNDMDCGVENDDVSGGYYFMNSHTLSEANNHNSIDYTKKRDGNVSNVSEMEDTELQDGVDIDVMLPASTLHQYSNM